MLRPRTLLLACLPLLVGATGAGADIIHLHANLTNTQEIGGTPPAATTPFTESPGGPARPVSFGHASFVVDTTLHMMTMTVTIHDMDLDGTQTAYTHDDLVNAHIHAPAPAGANAGVRWGFVGTPCHDLPAPCTSDFAPLPGGGVGGVYTLTWDTGEGAGGFAASEDAILAGLSYINFHTVQFPNGEIRGQIIPEPGSLALLAIGAFGLMAPALRRRRK